MAVKMRINNNADAICSSCEAGQKDSLLMHDLMVGKTMLTVCDICNEELFTKTLKVDCAKNAKIKSEDDLKIIRRRSLRRMNP